MHPLHRSIVAALFVLLCGCNASSVKDAIDVADGVPRKTIDTSKLGLNAFAYDTRFGSSEQQFLEVRDTLRLSHVRILLAWDSGTHPSAESNPSFNFIDSIVSALPEGVSAMAVVTGMPSWMSNSANWIDGNPRTTYVQRWLKPLVQRYADNPRVIGFQIWNEPNMQTTENSIMGFGDPASYVEMLALAHNVIRESAPGKLVISSATTAINQNYPDSLNYNRAMRDAGAQDLCDIWAAHYYGKQFERVVAPDGVADFLNGLKRPIWITESGAQGVNEQLPYGEQAWPFLLDEIPGIQRIYAYQFTESTPAESTYGLRNLTPGASVSDLYVWLRDRA
jgi:hypothetical protein